MTTRIRLPRHHRPRFQRLPLPTWLRVIVITLGMGAFYGRYFARHIAEDAARAGKQSQ